ncbi:MAG: hypothetical protein IKJ37_04285 [Kiritimatiellae bacterium]|nr:hypothetical protein [Kiritimatiellia bacterium]
MCSSCFARGGEDPFARKWFLANEIDFKASDKECARLETLLGTAREAGYNGVMISSWLGLDVLHTPIWTPERKERLMRIKRRCDDLGLEIGVCVWTFGYARQGFFKIDQNLSAAAPVFDTRYRVEDGRCIHLPVRRVTLLNPIQPQFMHRVFPVMFQTSTSLSHHAVHTASALKLPLQE